MVPLPYRVAARTQDTADTATLLLEPQAEGIPTPAPGQFNMLWAFGVGEAPISLAGVEPPGKFLHTIRTVGAVTAALCAADVGDVVGVRGPHGTGWQVARAQGRDVLVVAGGLGLAPVRPIITEVLENRAQYGRVTLLVGARTPADLLYGEELEAWSTRDDLEVGITVDSADRAWRGEVGVVTRLMERCELDGGRTVAFVCGPEVMMRFAAVAATDLGVSPERVFLSMERNMHCAIGHCGHCQLGPHFICKGGPVLSWPVLEPLMRVRSR